MRALLLAALVAGAGCDTGLVHHCASAGQCVNGGDQGFCEDTGFCSFGDSSCAGGRRYGEWAGSLANQCVSGGGNPDGAASADARPDGSGGDAPPAPDGAADARPIDGAPPDAPGPDAPAPIVTTFGERLTSVHQNVTRDGTISSDNALTTTLDESVTNFGADHSIEIDNASSGSPRDTHGLVRFDVSAIPTGATVLSAHISLYTDTDEQTVGTIGVYPLLEAWIELQATWIDRVTATAWMAAGADPPSRGTTPVFAFVPLGLSASCPTPCNAENTITLPASLVQGWVDSPSTNFGVVLVNSTSDGIELRSRDNTTEAHRPELTVTYQP